MNISSVSSTSNSTYTSGNDSDVTQLSNRLKLLQSQIDTENQSKDDAKTKQEKIQLLQTQIIQIQAQIQAKQSSQNSNNNSTSNSNNTQETTCSIVPSDNIIDLQA